MQRPLRILLLIGAATAATAQPTAAPVAVAPAEPVSVTETLRLTGTLTAARHARLSPRVDGLVTSLRADSGDRVAAGDVLLELDAALAGHAVARAESSVAEARAALTESARLVEEARQLIGERHLPETELGRRQAELELARARLAAAEAALAEQVELLSRHTLPAPFAGVIAERLTDVGEWVVRGTPVFELVSTDTIWLDVQAPQEIYSRIGKESRVRVQADALPGEPLAASIAAVVPVSDPNARSFLVRIVVEESDRALPPGTSAVAVIDLENTVSALAVPRTAVRRYPDGSESVFVVVTEDGALVAVERRVVVGGGSGQHAEVLEGLQPNERVVVRGWDALRDGDRVIVRDDS